MRICISCNKKYQEKHRTQKYCSKKCAANEKSKRHWKNVKSQKYTITCEICNKKHKTSRKETRFCSNKCMGKSRRKYLDIPDCLENSHKKIDKNIGYVRIYAPMHKEANTWGYVYEHRLVAEQMIERPLKKNEVVHHINGKRWDNRKENLQVMDKVEHSKIKP